MDSIQKGEQRFKDIQYILTNGFYPKEKLEILKRFGIRPKSIQGESQDEFYNGALANLKRDYKCYL